MSIEPTYFTCTLGQATSLGLQQPHGTINELLDHKAAQEPQRPAVGFAVPSASTAWHSQVFTFADIRNGSCHLAAHLSQQYAQLSSGRTTVGLLCPSTPEFLLTWLALIRLGHAVLLIAPQCAPNAVQALCEQCEVQLLLYDESYAELATSSASNGEFTAAVLPFADDFDIGGLLATTEPSDVPNPNTGRTDVAYLHHTSGTSTGIPKPIPQSHNAAVGVLPQLASGKDCATFTTTPLYHGGVADCFRAWSSSALIWLFPGKSVPITASNIIKCLEVAEQSAKTGTTPVKYFSSVPYVLQLLEAEKQGLAYLQSMDMVGVGGAALPVEVGDRLVSKHVNLLSRFGSAECGFLLSSHRNFANDKDWQYLRCASDLLRFEPQDAALHELVISKGWPHMAKRNRDDGSFATADLFAAHPSIAGAWKYHSRSDSQLTLITGKKFDPAPLEADIATSELLSDAVIFGNGQPYPGVLLFKATDMPDEKLLQDIWPKIEKLNRESQEHAKISRGMLVPMAVLETPLEKSSKGTLLRPAAESRYQKVINQAYETVAGDDVADDELPQAINKIVTDVSHKSLSLDNHTDLFSAGIDSVAGMQIRSRIRALLPQDRRGVPMTIVEDCGNINGLVQYVKSQRSGQAVDGPKLDDTQYMLQLVDEYSHFRDEPLGRVDETPGEVIVLTGATGALGAHVLDQYRKSDQVRKIYCLVRGADAHAASERVEKGLKQRKLGSLDSKVAVIPARLADADLGLDSETYHQIASEMTKIMHVAWSVNFRMRLTSFVKDNIAGVNNLINLALASPRRDKPVFCFCSSVASAMAWHDDTVPEEIINDPGAASPLGYSQSKWVAEQICSRAKHTSLADKIVICRVGQLSGDSHHGVWNSSEAWPLMLSSLKETGCLPDLQEVLDWLPVDLAATALVQGAAHKAEHSKGISVYHVVNYHTGPSWADMITWLRMQENVELLSPLSWVGRLTQMEAEGSTNPALRLLSHWQNAYDADNGIGSAESGKSTMIRVRQKSFETAQTRSEVPVLERIKPVDEVYFDKLWHWIKSNA